MKKSIVLLLLGVNITYAAENASGVLLPAGPIGSGLNGMVFSLFALLIILMGIYWFSRRLLTQRLGRGRIQSMQILSVTMLGPKEKIIIVDTREGEALILGVTSQHITLLDKRPLDKRE